MSKTAPADSGLTSRPDIVAVTVTYNSADVLTDFLASVHGQQGNWRLVIVDNASSDATREQLAAISDDRIHIILNDHNVGFAAASNQGIVWALDAGAESVLLINNDTLFEPHLFQGLVDKLRDDVADAVSPVIVFAQDPDKIWYAGGNIKWKFAVRNVHASYGESRTTLPDGDFPAEFVPMCCAAIKRSVFDAIGLIDEDYFVYWEDADFSHRMNLAKLRIAVAPSLTMLHKDSTLTGGLMSQFSTRQYCKNRVIFVRKSLGWVGQARQIAMIGAAILGRSLFKGNSMKVFGVRLMAMWDGMTARISPPKQVRPVASAGRSQP